MFKTHHPTTNVMELIHITRRYLSHEAIEFKYEKQNQSWERIKAGKHFAE